MILVLLFLANASGPAVYAVRLWPLVCWDCGCVDVCVLSVLCVAARRGLCERPITRPGVSCRVYVVCGHIQQYPCTPTMFR